MKKKVSYDVNGRQVEKEVSYIPVRYIVAFAITAFEIAAMIGITLMLCAYVPYFYLAAWLTEIGCVIRIISSDDNPDYKVPWLLLVLILPVAGFMLYLIFSSRKLKKKYVRRLAAIREHACRRDDAPAHEQLERESPAIARQARMLCAIADTHLYTDTRQTYFSLGEEMHARMLEDLEAAQKFIYLEFFIIEEGVFWNSVLDILKRKAAQGVEVRVLYDDVGCMMTLPGDYAAQLREAGIAAAPFSRMTGDADSEFNNRSHRKILVIDGRIGYAGGVNLADEYINAVTKYGHWKDTAVRLEGEAVWELTQLFLVDFGVNFRKMPQMRTDCFPACADVREAGWLIPFGDGPRPLYQRQVGKSVIMNLLNSAVRYVYMTTPYLIIDNELCGCIENAALRGVDVRIIVPHIPDKKTVFEVTRSFYPRLMAAGVKIYEYEPGFIHAKSYLADDDLGMIGSINLDYRSLTHHFENGVWMYRCACLKALRADIGETMNKSILITDDMLKTPLSKRIMRAVVRIFAPML